MFKKVLVANRGEIACRIIRALREMKIISVAVYSQADKDALHTQLADEAIQIGPANSLNSYQNPVAILTAAMVTGADAIHPGYGFLSERHDFIQICEDVGMEFIGPKSDVVKLMGNKQNARVTMEKAGVPIVPGSKGLVYSLQEAKEVAKAIGFPLMVKAADGGGGRGMRRVESMEDLPRLFEQAQQETQSIYGNKDLYIERIIAPARHIEVQLLADEQGKVIHLGERDCSLQRNHQKVLEIAPAPFLPEVVRERMHRASVKAAQSIDYWNAGTIEYLVDEDNQFYFMEMNTRLQVEHTISEAVSGIDIVKEQINIAMGLPLSFKQEDIQLSGYAIEARLNAENPKENFLPASGHIERLLLPVGGLGLRVETGVYSNYTLPPFYDSMIAKVITYAPTLEEAFIIMQRALDEVVVQGVETNIELLQDLSTAPELLQDSVHTMWLQEIFMPQWLATLESQRKE